MNTHHGEPTRHVTYDPEYERLLREAQMEDGSEIEQPKRSRFPIIVFLAILLFGFVVLPLVRG